MAVIDIDSSIVTDYPAVSAYKTSNNLISPYCILTFPKVALAEKEYWLSTQYMCCAATVDATNNGAPFESPSNKRIPIDTLILANGDTFSLNLQAANQLNLIGVVTARLFGQQGWVLWGNQTSAFPGSTDPVQEWIPVARMFYWYGGSLVVSTLQFVDKPGVPRQVERLQDSVNLWNNALIAQQALLSGDTTFDPADNPTENLLQGIFSWRSSICPPIPMQVINNLLIYDISGLNNLFQNSGLSSGS
jgi:phage tail sheath protein FI